MKASRKIVIIAAAAILLLIIMLTLGKRLTLEKEKPMNTRTLELDDQTLSLKTEYAADFSEHFDHWLVEGTQLVGVENGRLSIDAVRGEPHVATVWCMQEFAGDQVIEYDARIEPTLDEKGHGETNMNFLLFGSDPAGTPLRETSSQRTGAYKEYHALNNYILTYLNSDKQGKSPIHGECGEQFVRVRFRKDPGFELVQENWRRPPIEKGRDYHFAIVVQGERIRIYVDGVKIVDVSDGTHRSGWHGFRTWMSHLSVKTFQVSRIVE